MPAPGTFARRPGHLFVPGWYTLYHRSRGRRPPVQCGPVSSDRERLRTQLKKHGDRRRAARVVEREQLDAIARLLPQALRAGISKREIARLTGVSRTWLEALTQRDEPD